MKKRIFISSLTLLFLVSTTGLPITINMCKMAENMKTDECAMHHKPVKSQCCDDETLGHPVTISYDISDCCQSEFVYNKVRDDFIYNNSEINFFSSYNNLCQLIISLLPKVNFSNETSFYCDSSPPFLINPELHITNSILLI